MKAQALITRELDLEKFIKRMRMQLTLAMGLLTARQKIYIERTSRLLVHESSFSSEDDRARRIKNHETSSSSKEVNDIDNKREL